jgi:hypothetical protein
MRWVALAVAVVAAAAVGGWRLRRSLSRQRRLMLLCRRARLDFAAMDLFETTTWLPFPMFGPTGHGTENLVWERERGFEIRAFDYWYEDPSDERPIGSRRRLTCAVVPLGTSGRRLRVAPRDLDDEVRDLLGLHEIELELETFNRRFAVHAEDERFAIAFLEQRMMEAILALPAGVTLDVNEDVILLSAPELPAEQVLRLYDAAVAIGERIPHSLASLFPPRPVEGPHEDRWLQGHWSPEPIEGPGA